MEIVNGNKVKIIDGDIIATVIGVCIRGVGNQTFEYNVSWFSGGTRHDAWLWDFQIERHIETKRKAGMVNYDSDESQKALN